MARRNTYISFWLPPNAPMFRGVEVPAYITEIEVSLRYIPIYLQEGELVLDEDAKGKHPWGLEFYLLGSYKEGGLTIREHLGIWAFPYDEVSPVVKDDLFNYVKLPGEESQAAKDAFFALLQKHERRGKLD